MSRYQVVVGIDPLRLPLCKEEGKTGERFPEPIESEEGPGERDSEDFEGVGERFEPEVFAGVFTGEDAGGAFFPEHADDVGPAQFEDDGAKPGEDEGDAEGAGEKVVPVEESPKLAVVCEGGDGHDVEEEEGVPLGEDAGSDTGEGGEPPED